MEDRFLFEFGDFKGLVYEKRLHSGKRRRLSDMGIGVKAAGIKTELTQDIGGSDHLKESDFKEYGLIKRPTGKILKKAAYHFYGEVSKDLPNGLGIMVSEKDSAATELSGNFVDGKLNGKGRLTYTAIDKEDRKVAFGTFQNSKMNGFGVLFYRDGKRKYSGQWKDGVFHGKGIFFHDFNVVTKGEFKNGKLNGAAVREFSNGLKLFGEFKDDEFQGIGKLIYSNDEYYEGEFATMNKFELTPHGFGEKVCKAGTTIARCVGEFKFGKLDGKANVVFDSGDSFLGEFKADLKQGFGVYTFANGNVYTGNFRNDRFDGNGELKFANGNLYKGEFKKGKMHGEGRFIWKPNGRKRRREEEDDEEMEENLQEYQGKFENNKMQPYGTIIFLDGSKFEGKINDGAPHGKGRFSYPDSSGSVELEYVNGELKPPKLSDLLQKLAKLSSEKS